MTDSDFEPDLGEATGVSAPLTDGLRAKAERIFIEMIRAAFLGHDTFPYSDDPAERRLDVQSALSNEDQAYFPRIEIRVGPISEYEGSINNLNKWTKTVRRHVYADQAQVMFICTAEESAEANALGDRVRRLIDLARPDLGARGIFGMMKPKMQAPQPARQGTEQDDLYQAAVQSGFVILERQERRPDPDDPLYGGVAQGSEYSLQDDSFECSADTDEPSPVRPESLVASTGESTSAKAVLTFSADLCTYQVDGVTAEVGQSERRPDVVRDHRNKSALIIELPGVRDGTPIRIEYEDGNLMDHKNRPVQAFGPIQAQWKE